MKAERNDPSVGISDLIAEFLQSSLDTSENGVLEVQRSDLAQRFNCVPSQINYVMSTRFSPGTGLYRGKPPRRQWIYPDYPGTGGPADADDARHQFAWRAGGSGFGPGHFEQPGAGRGSGTAHWHRRFWRLWETRPWQRCRGSSGTRSGRISCGRH